MIGSYRRSSSALLDGDTVKDSRRKQAALFIECTKMNAYAEIVSISGVLRFSIQPVLLVRKADVGAERSKCRLSAQTSYIGSLIGNGLADARHRSTAMCGRVPAMRKNMREHDEKMWSRFCG